MAKTRQSNCGVQKLTQTKLSTYFTGCIKKIPMESGKKPRVRKRLSFPSVTSTTTNDSISRTTDFSITLGIQKRKLPIPICSEDEDPENDGGSDLTNKSNGYATPKKRNISISLNKPPPLSSRQSLSDVSYNCTSTSNDVPDTEPSPSTGGTQSDSSVTTSPSKAASPSSSGTPTTSNAAATPSKTVPISQNTSSKKDPVRNETKKVNYEQLRVMRELFVNVLNNNRLMSLLTASDEQLLRGFFNIERDYQYLCVKLFLWKPTWYNIFTFSEKIGLPMAHPDVSAMYNFFKNGDFVDTDYMGEELFELLDLLSLKDVREIGRSFRFSNVSGTKESLISKLLSVCKTQLTLTTEQNCQDVLRKRIKEQMGHCVKLSAKLRRCIYYVYLLNTFTNTDLIDPREYFKTVIYLKTVFPTYNVENFRIFYTPHEFSSFADAVKLRDQLEKAVEKKKLTLVFEICKSAYNMLKQLNEKSGDSHDILRQPHLERFTPNAQYIYIISSGSKHITTGHFDHVKVWFEYLLSQGYCKYRRGDWYCHLALIYTTYCKCYQIAAKLLIKALKEDKENFSDIQLQELAHRGKMLNRKTYNIPALFHDEIVSLSSKLCEETWSQDVVGSNSKRGEDPGRKRLYVHHGKNGDVTYLTVEQTALKYYQTVGFPYGEHCEGSLIIAAFSLLFWDIIYETSVSGVFVSNVQNVPLDMYTKYFYINRKDRIDRRLNNIKERWDEDVLKKKITKNWTRHSHETALCQIDTTVQGGVEQLFNVILCIGRPILAKIFQRLVTNFRLYRSGFPDLIVWNLKEKRAKFVEVKSENDKLSTKQKLWLNYLVEIGALAAVCHVEPKSSRKKFSRTKEKPKNST